MHVCLISPLTVTDFINPESTLNAALDRAGPNLGILALAASLKQADISVEIFHLDQVFVDFLKPFADAAKQGSATSTDGRLPDLAHFFDYARDLLGAIDADLFGFGSMCSSYPMTLRLAEAVKRAKPQAKIVFGGPQASVVDEATLRDFACVDYVVRGEADVSFPKLVAALADGACPEDLAGHKGLTYRLCNKVIRNPDTPALADLDDLPLPAFELDPYVLERGGLHLEAGRGCPFACAFCSTNDFFRRNYRLKSPTKLVGEMVELNARYGVTAFTLVHDMFTVNRKKVAAFCEALLEAGHDFTWSCSARTDCVDEELLTLMARAGCRGIFFGIETGSPRLQPIIQKNIDLDEAWQSIETACKLGMGTAVALITGFPQETREDLAHTANFFVRSLRIDNAEPQLSVLAPLAKTPIADQHRDALYFDGKYSDMSHQGWRQDPADIELIRTHKEVFVNFYAVPTEAMSRDYFIEMRDFLMGLGLWLRWLPVALVTEYGNMVEVFDRWRQWNTDNPVAAKEPAEVIAPDYCTSSFQSRFADFVRQELLPDNETVASALRALADIEAPSKELLRKRAELKAAPDAEQKPGSDPEKPALAPTVNLFDLPVNYRDVLDHVREQASLTSLELDHSSVLLVARDPEKIEICEIDLLQQVILRSCRDGLDLDGITGVVENSGVTVGGISGRKLAIGSLHVLKSRGLIEWQGSADQARPMNM